MNPIEAPSVPALAPGVRLQTDRMTGDPVLLSPEGILILNETAREIAARCDGQRTVGQIVEALAAEYDAPPEALREDVIACLAELREKSLLVLS